MRLTKPWKSSWQDLLMEGQAGQRGAETCPVLGPALLTTDHRALEGAMVVLPCSQVGKWGLREK